MTLLKTAIFTLVVPCTVVILIPYWLASSSGLPPVPVGFWRYTGVLPMLMGAAIYLWCAWDFTFAGRGTPAPIDPPKELVVRGLYRYLRNPMYVGILSLLLGEALLFESRALLLFFLFVVAYEEPALRRKFGDSYRQYCRDVSRWLPFKIRSRRKSRNA